MESDYNLINTNQYKLYKHYKSHIHAGYDYFYNNNTTLIKIINMCFIIVRLRNKNNNAIIFKKNYILVYI